jgi:hypothetical protein
MALDFSGLADGRKDWKTESYSTEWAIDCGAESAEAAVQELEAGHIAEGIKKLLLAVSCYGVGTGRYQLKNVMLYDRGMNALDKAKKPHIRKDNAEHEQLRIAK